MAVIQLEWQSADMIFHTQFNHQLIQSSVMFLLIYAMRYSMRKILYSLTK